MFICRVSTRNGMDFDIRTGPAEGCASASGSSRPPTAPRRKAGSRNASKSSEAGLLLYQRFVAEFVDTVRREDPHAVTAIHGGEHPG